MIGRLSSVDAAGVTWRSARASSAAVELDRVGVGDGQLRVLVGRRHPQA